jgi:hypothetical protein
VRILQQPHEPTFQFPSPLPAHASHGIALSAADALPSMALISESLSSRCISPQESNHPGSRSLVCTRLSAATLLRVTLSPSARARPMRIKIGCASPSRTRNDFSRSMAGCRLHDTLSPSRGVCSLLACVEQSDPPMTAHCVETPDHLATLSRSERQDTEAREV